MSAQGRPRQYGKRVSTAFRLKAGVHQRLQAEAEARDVSMNLLVERAVVDYLDRLVPVDEIVLTRPAKHLGGRE